MTDYDDLVPDPDEDESCPGEDDCEDPYCDEREEYEVEWTFTAKATVRAHSQDEAENLAMNVQGDLYSFNSPPLGDEWEDDLDNDSEYVVQSKAERMAEDARFRAQVAAALRADESPSSSG